MEWMIYLVASLFSLLGAGCVALIVVGLPGGWFLLGLAMLVDFLDRFYLPSDRPLTFGWWVLGVAAGLLLLGEALEVAAGAAGAKRGGGSKRGMVGALIGGMLGAIVLTGFIPIPVLGTVIGALVGTFIGAILGEISGENARTLGESVKPALGATAGRVAGTVSKLVIAVAVWGILSVAAFWP